MIKWLKKLFYRSDPTDMPAEEAILCRFCGKPISAGPTGRSGSYCCSACKANEQAGRQGTITITCRKCGRTFSLPEDVQHWPDYCQACRAKAPAQTITRKCRSCGEPFSFPSTLTHWPNYCRDCQAKRKKRKA